MPEPNNAPNPLPESGFLSAFRISGDFSDVVRRHVVNLTFLFGSLGALWAGAHALGWSDWLASFIAVGPPAIVYFWTIRPQQRARERQAQLIRISKQAENTPGQSLVGAEYFLIGPYPQERRVHYQRADGVHEKVLRWVRQTQEQILILTGDSGVGKSSLLQAYVIPELENGETPFKVLTVRSFDDPLRELNHQLSTLWERPPDDLGTHAGVFALERAIGRVKRINTNARLLIVFDQLEEFIILADNESAKSTSLQTFLKEVREGALKDCIVMLTLRSEYRPHLEGFGITSLREGYNWQEVPAFIYSDAAAFLRDPIGELHIEDDQLNRILSEAAAVDGTPKLIRPIILNMLGVVMRRIAGRPPSNRSTSKLLEGDLRDIVNDPRRRDVARTILPHLITDADTKRPRTIGAIHMETHLDPAIIHGCMLDLELSGYTRQLSRPDAIEDRLWEVSHDFVARLLGPILKTSWETKWNTIRPYIFAAFLLSWLAALLSAPSLVKWYGRLQAETTLRDRYQFMLHKTISGYTATQVTNEDENLKDAFTLLSKLNPVITLNLGASSQLTQLNGIEKLSNLTVVYLADCFKLSKLDGLEKLNELQSVNLRMCHSITNVRAFSGAAGPQSLDLSNCSNLETLDGLQDSSNLQSLFCEDCTNLTNINALKQLSSLQTLDLGGCQKLSPSDILNSVPDVQYLNLTGCQFFNAASLRKLVNLERLNLSGCPELVSLNGLQSSQYLQQLNTSNCPKLYDIDAIDKLDNITAIDLSGCSKVGRITSIENKKNLVTLYLGGCTRISNIDAICNLPQLRDLDLSNCAGLVGPLPLSKLLTLEILKLRGNENLDNLEAIAELKHLSFLDISSSKRIINLQGVRDLPNLKRINADNCTTLANVLGLSHLPKLAEMRFSGCTNLVSLEGVDALESLESINLYGCGKLHDITPLEKCLRLKTVDLRQIENLNLADIAHLKAILPQTNIQISEELYKPSGH